MKRRTARKLPTHIFPHTTKGADTCRITNLQVFDVCFCHDTAPFHLCVTTSEHTQRIKVWRRKNGNGQLVAAYKSPWASISRSDHERACSCREVDTTEALTVACRTMVCVLYLYQCPNAAVECRKRYPSMLVKVGGQQVQHDLRIMVPKVCQNIRPVTDA